LQQGRAGRHETIISGRRSDPETSKAYQVATSVKWVRQMIEAVTAILGLFGTGIFIAHAIDAYLAP